MAAPAVDSSTTAVTTSGHDDEAVVKTTMPLPHAIHQLVMAISSRSSKSAKTATASMKTIGEHGVDRFLAWMNLVFMPSMFIAIAALSIYDELRDEDDYDGVISGGGGFVFLTVQVLPHVYLAAVLVARGHLELFAPQTPYAACEALNNVGFKGLGLPVIFTSLVALLLYALMPDKAWLLLVACAYLLGLLVASIVAFWICLLRTYGDGGGERQEKNSSCGEAVIDGLAYLYCRLLYECAVRFLDDADAGMQQLDTDRVVAVV